LDYKYIIPTACSSGTVLPRQVPAGAVRPLRDNNGKHTRAILGDWREGAS